MDKRFIENIAHRGASAYAPENTFAAFSLALEMGADALETDLRLTADGHLVLMHDDTVDRTTNGQGPVSSLTLSQVQSLDAGAWFAPEMAEQRVPTLEEFLDVFGEKVHLALELKGEGTAVPSLAEVRRRGLLESTTFTSFSLERLLAVLADAPDANTGYLTREVGSELMAALISHGVRQICPLAAKVTESLVSEAHDLGLSVRAWGVRDERLMVEAIEAGVDGMTVNWPDKLREELARRRLNLGEGPLTP